MERVLQCFFILWTGSVFAQDTSTVFGNIITPERTPISGVQIVVVGASKTTFSDALGEFQIQLPRFLEQQELSLSHPDFVTQRIILSAGQESIRLQNHVLFRKLAIDDPSLDAATNLPVDSEQQLGFGTLLNAQRSPFLNAVAFHFSPMFFRPQGLNSNQQEVLINGIPVNDTENGRPIWSTWGGINDFSNAGQENFFGITSQSSVFGGLLGTTEFSLWPSALREGTKISTAFSNASYSKRFMASHLNNSGNAFNYGLLFSYRSGKEGFHQGTEYSSYSFAGLFEAFLSAKLSVKLSVLYTPTQRGQNAPITQEVFNLKGPRYNPYWGWWKGKKRNARIKSVDLPQAYINLTWEPQLFQNWEWALKLQKGESSSTRLLYNGSQPEGNFHNGGGTNPSPVYYQKLPSYFLRTTPPNFESAFWAEKQLEEQGQLDWSALFEGNLHQEWAIYAQTKAVKKQSQIATVLRHNRSIGSFFQFSSYLYLNRDTMVFYNTPSSLFGAKNIWNTNNYATTYSAGFNDLKNPNTPIKKGMPFEYHYAMRVAENEIGVQLAYEKKLWKAFIALKKETLHYQRRGYFQNGVFPEDSYGEGLRLQFQPNSIKAGIRFAPSGRHYLSVHGAYIENAPTLSTAYLQPRVRDYAIPNAKVQQTKSLLFNYNLTTPTARLQFTLFRHLIENATQSRYYYADGIGGDQALFVQEILSDIAQQNIGLQFGGTVDLTAVLSAQGAVNFGRYQFSNNPHVLLASMSTTREREENLFDGTIAFGPAFLKGYFTPSGPQKAFHLGLQYADPSYWRIGIYGNYFEDSFINFNPLTRTSNFYTDRDGLPFAAYDPQKAAALLEQEKLPPVFLLNLTFNKSWRIKSQYCGIFLSVQNLLNRSYKSGGFEQGRNANYPTLLEDQQRLQPLFAPKYWWGRGTTFFSSLYYRF